MLIQTEDFNGSDGLLNNDYAAEWQDIEQVLRGMPLHLKASDQAGLQGNAIFDPVGTNEYIKASLLQHRGWYSNVSICQVPDDCIGTKIGSLLRAREILELLVAHAVTEEAP